jgi:AraC-like DNA-binding protein
LNGQMRAIFRKRRHTTALVMLSGAHATPTVPVSYVWLLLALSQELGASRTDLLEGLDVTDAVLNDPHGRVSLRPTYAELSRRAMRLTGEPGLGYLFGLRASLTTHGIVGYGLMAQPTLREVLAFGQQFGTVLRLSAWDLQVQADAQSVRIWAVDSQPRNDIREYSAQVLIVSNWVMLCELLPACRDHAVLAFDFPTPAYHARFADRLPRCVFGAPFNEIRLPARFLDMPLHSANAESARLAERECLHDLGALDAGRHDDLIRRARRLMTLDGPGYPSASALAASLHVSARTLARQLSAQGCSHRQLLDDARQRDSRVLLLDPSLSVAQVAEALGYRSTSAFSRAFHGWAACSPSTFRQQHRPSRG